MRIQHNISAMYVARNMAAGNGVLAKSLERLSSGFAINRSADDAAGLAISEKMQAQITGLSQAQRNAKDGISAIQVAEGALDEVHGMLNRMTTLADQSMNGTYEVLDRQQLDTEYQNLIGEIDRIAESTRFGDIHLLDGSQRKTDVNGGGDAARKSVRLGGLDRRPVDGPKYRGTYGAERWTDGFCGVHRARAAG